MLEEFAKFEILLPEMGFAGRLGSCSEADG